MTKIEYRYQAALASIPATGNGCHPRLLGVANLGIMAGRTDDEMLAEISAAIPPGGRRDVKAPEILETIDRARQDTVAFKPVVPSRRQTHRRRRTVADIRAEVVKDEATAAELRRAVIAAGGGELDPFGAEVRESSPIRLEAYSEDFPHAGSMLLLLQHLYRPDDLLFVGQRMTKAKLGRDVRTAAEWIRYFQDWLVRIAECPYGLRQREFEQMGERYPLIIPNPLTGREGKTQDGDPSFRADSCVGDFRYIIAEFDEMPFAEQGAILRGLGKVGAKIAAVIYRGGKSCHAWIRCEGVTTAEEWRTQVKDGLFPILKALGVDGACSNPARMSRLPGVFRADSRKWQQLLFLAPEGGAL